MRADLPSAKQRSVQPVFYSTGVDCVGPYCKSTTVMRRGGEYGLNAEPLCCPHRGLD